jgi:hypothetical protein
MNEAKHNAPYWMRAHRDWRVWVGVVLMLAAMIIYLLTGDLAWRPRVQPQPVLSGTNGK